MNAFEIVFTLMTMITSLALAHLLNGFVILLRNAKRVRFSLVHGLWSWIALAVLIGNWASFWGMRSVESWPSLTVLLILATATIEYIFCAMVTPEMPAEGKLNLREFHAHSHRLYTLALVILLFLSLLLNLLLGAMNMYENWWHDSILTIAALLLSTLAIFLSHYWVQVGVAVVNALIVTYYLVISCNLVNV
jgi:hypothetical protein